MGKVLGLVLAVTLLSGTSQAIVGEPAMLLEADDLEFPEVHASWFDPSTIPARIQELDGTFVVVYGTMYPTLVDNRRGLFMAGDTRVKPRVRFDSTQLRYAQFAVELTHDISYEPRKTIRVEGTLRVRPQLRRGELRYLFTIEDARAEEAPLRTDRYQRINFYGC